jgi:predicted porin
MFNLGEISMKKSLVALAVLASAGAAFAQSTVTLSGTYSFGFAYNKNSTFPGGVEAASKASGFGTDTAAIKLAAVEDLGGGLKVAASVTAASLYRGAGVVGEDARLDLTTGFGRFSMGTIESGTGIRPLSEAGAPVLNLETEVFNPASNIDFIGFQSGSFGGVSLGVSYVDRGAPSVAATTTTAAIASSGTGLGLGTTGGANAQPSITPNVTYGNGPINARLDATFWTRKEAAVVDNNLNNNRVRLSGNYDLGVVKLGAGVSQQRQVAVAGVVTKQTEFGLGVSAPLGPVTVGAYYANQKTTGTALSVANRFLGKKDGFSVGAKYDLSKRTNISSNFAAWTHKNTAGAKVAKGQHFEVLMNHNF